MLCVGCTHAMDYFYLVLFMFSLALALFALEVVVPGGWLGLLGGMVMFAACVVVFIEYGLERGFLTLAIGVLLTVLTLVVEFWLFRKTKLGKKLFLDAEVTSVSHAPQGEALDLIGKSAEAVTMLSPTGYILVDGKRYEGFSESGQIAAGQTLIVVGVDSFRVIVSSSL